MYIAQHDEGFIGCMRVKVYPQTRHISYTGFVLPAIFLCDPSHASEVVMGNVFAKLFPRADTLIVTDRIGKGGYGEVFRGTLGSTRSIRLPADHPLRPLILQCLQNDPAKRPSCSEVLH